MRKIWVLIFMSPIILILLVALLITAILTSPLILIGFLFHRQKAHKLDLLDHHARREGWLKKEQQKSQPLAHMARILNFMNGKSEN